MRTGGALAALATWLVTSVAPAQAQPPEPVQRGADEQRQHTATIVSSEVEAFTGPVEKHCGIFTLTTGPDGPPAAARKQIAAALKCVQDAQRRGKAAWAVWQVTGVDATIFDGVAATAVSAVHVVQSEGVAGEVRVLPCLRPRVEKNGAIACANTATPNDLGKALDRLGRDVRRAAGVDPDAFVAQVAQSAPVAAGPVDTAAHVAHAVATARRMAHDAGASLWPVCPRHFDHEMAVRDGWWFCEREAAFIVELGSVWRVLPRRRR